MNKTFFVGVFSWIICGFNVEASIKTIHGRIVLDSCSDNELPYPIIRAMAAAKNKEIPQLAQATTVSHGGSFHELSRAHTSNGSFTSIETTSSDTQSLHSPEGVSLYPFSPVPIVKDSRPLGMYNRQITPRYLQYIGVCQVMIQSDSEEWRDMVGKRKEAFRSGKF